MFFISELDDDLFKYVHNYIPCQCISSDYAMGRGIAVEMDRAFNLKKHIGNYCLQYGIDRLPFPSCVYAGGVLNLVTKERYFHKPNYRTLEQSLLDMRSVIDENKIERVVMPVIGCGLDGLQWDRVKTLICEIFGQKNLYILVCKI